MIKILIAGKVKEKCTKMVCGDCGCQFTYQQDDVKADDRPCAEPFVPCPQVGCGVRCYVMKEKV